MASISSLLNGSAAVSRALGAPSAITNALSGAGQFASSFGKAKDVLAKPASPNLKAGLYDVGTSLLNPMPNSTTMAVGKALFGASPTQQTLKAPVTPVAQKQVIQKQVSGSTTPITPTLPTQPTQPTTPMTSGGAAMKQNPDGTFSLTNPTPTITVASTESPTPTDPTQRDTYLKQIADSLKQTPDEISYQDKLSAIQAQQANLSASEQLGLNKIQDQAIAMPFITGQQAALQRSVAGQEQALTAQQVPLQTRLAQLQAERTRQGEAAKFGYESEKPIEVGGQLINPNTGAVVFAGATKQAEGFTLGEGQARYDASGKLIANVPKFESIQGKQLTPDQINRISEGNQMPIVLTGLATLIDSNNDKFGPVAGRYFKANPYEPGGQAIQAELKRAMQSIGKYLEGGVLRAEDEKKYEQMLPQIIDTPEVAKAKLIGIDALLKAKQQQYLQDVQSGGYNASNFSSSGNAHSEEAQFLKSKGYDDASIEKLLGKTNDLSTSQNGSIKLGSPLAVANNNPGNLRFVGQPGAVQGKGGFAKFESPEAGIQAMKNLLVLRKNQGMTLNQLINSYAPPIENDTDLYINQISSALNVPPNTPLSQIDINALARAMAKKESSSIIG